MSAIEPIPGIEPSYDVHSVAAALGISAKTVRKLAGKHGIGTNWGGSCGYRFTASDVEQLRQQRRPLAAPAARDPRARRAATRASRSAS